MAETTTIHDYIEDFWDRALTPAGSNIWGTPRNIILHLGRIKLPHKVVSPNNDYFAATQYYWDTYFTVIGLLEAKQTETARGMVDNLVYLFNKFGFIPARNSLTSFGRTQPPLLTRMAWEVYAADKDDAWLDGVMRVAEQEYLHVWNSGRRFHADSGLNRYRPWALRKILTVYESGWDVSSRFAFGRTSLLPVDLNCMLYRYEKDIEAWCRLRKRHKEVITWRRRSEQRRHNIVEYCWDEYRGFFFDHDLDNKSTDGLWTLAGFLPLWAGLATKKQATRCVKQLDRFMQLHGVSTTEELPWRRRQWDFPNNWPPLQLMLVDGLRKYGYHKQAQHHTKQWLHLVEKVYDETGHVWEKYNTQAGTLGRAGRYPTQSGFAWTNAVYLRLLRYSKQRKKETT